ncbi:hypothetical protein [Mycobacteroides abscessus]|uniref:hypothetical protein n=1 Tax=Mycobacteroides abscessus TaxID=36809 RepID=UPI0009A6BA92|nr:hypothetical protein [Mycobacteroides abscessus]SLH14041.1 Uncharacterised protein [Mycobacteroides abscessus subsp. massiliense]
MTTEPFADQPATSQPAHWHVFADGPGTGPACVFGTDDPLDEPGALGLADEMVSLALAERVRAWDTFWVCRCPADSGCVLDEDNAGAAFDLATARPYWTLADDDAALAAQAADDARLALIPAPPGVIGDPTEWDWDRDLGMYTRYLTMGRWNAAGDRPGGGIRSTVELYVVQTETGALREWRIELNGPDLDAMTAEDTRRVAAALLEAASALEASQGFPSDRDDHHLDDHHLDDPDRDDHHLDDPAGGATIEAGQSPDSEPVA